jgi:type IV pilus assembly protein PilM
MSRGSAGIGIDIGGNYVRMVELQKRSGVYVVTAALKLHVSDLAEDEYDLDGDMARAISQALRSAHLDGKSRVLGISGKNLIIRYTEVPPVPDWRLRMIMEFEINEMAGRAGGDLSADFQLLNIPQNESGNFTVMVALAKNDFLHKRLDILGRNGLGAADMCPSSLALFNTFLMNEDITPGETTLVVDIGARNTEMLIQLDGALLFARNVSAGGNLFTKGIVENLRIPFPEAEKLKKSQGTVSQKGALKATDAKAEAIYGALTGVAQQFSALLRSSVMFCKSQIKMQDLSIDRILLSGGGSRLRGLRDNLANAFKVPCEVLHPMKTVELDVDDPDVEERIIDSPREWAVAVGLARVAMDDGIMELRLLPDEYKKRRQFWEQTIYLVSAGVLLVLFLGLLMFGAIHNRSVEEAHAKKITAALRATRSQRRQIKDIKDIAGRTTAFLTLLAAEGSSGAEFMRVVSWLRNNVTREIWFQSFSYKREEPATILRGDGVLTLTGAVEQTGGDPGAKLADLARRLKSLPDVREAEILERDTELGKVRFKIRVLLGHRPAATPKENEEEEE